MNKYKYWFFIKVKYKSISKHKLLGIRESKSRQDKKELERRYNSRYRQD